MVRIRAIAPGEHEALGRLTVETYDALPGGVGPGYAAVLRDVATRAAEAEVVVAVDDDDRLLGGVTYAAPPSPWAEVATAGEAEIRMLVVDPGAQRTGVGAALVRWCIDRARADGHRGVALWTTPVMHAAHRLYERLGFVRDAERDWQVPDGPLLLTYVLVLDRP